MDDRARAIESYFKSLEVYEKTYKESQKALIASNDAFKIHEAAKVQLATICGYKKNGPPVLVKLHGQNKVLRISAPLFMDGVDIRMEEVVE